MKTKRILKRTTLLMIAIAIVMLAAVSSQALADCNGKRENYRTFIVTYYEVDLPYDPSAPTDSRCTKVQTQRADSLPNSLARNALLSLNFRPHI